MKKAFLSFLTVCFIALFAFSCSDSGGDGGGGGGGGGVTVDTAETVAVTDVNHSFTGNGSAPANETDATDAALAVGDDVSSIGSTIASDMQSGSDSFSMRATQTFPATTVELDYYGSGFDSGTVTYSGTYSTSDFDMENDVTQTDTSMSIDTSMTMEASQNVLYSEVKPTGKSYTINGEQNLNMKTEASIDITISGNQSTQEITFSGSGITATMAFSDRACYALDGDAYSCYIVVSTDLTASLAITTAMLETMITGTSTVDDLDLTPTISATSSIVIYDTDGNEVYSLDLSENDDFLEKYLGSNLEGLEDMADMFAF